MMIEVLLTFIKKKAKNILALKTNFFLIFILS